MKRKSNLHQKTASPEQIYFVIKNGIKIYPISSNRQWFIEVDNNGVIFRFKKKISNDLLNESIAKTVIFYYNKLKEKK